MFMINYSIQQLILKVSLNIVIILMIINHMLIESASLNTFFSFFRQSSHFTSYSTIPLL